MQWDGWTRADAILLHVGDEQSPSAAFSPSDAAKVSLTSPIATSHESPVSDPSASGATAESTPSECLNESWFVSLADAQATIEAWRLDYMETRPHSGLAYRTPAEFAKELLFTISSLIPPTGLA
jgi:hypothetical protein